MKKQLCFVHMLALVFSFVFILSVLPVSAAEKNDYAAVPFPDVSGASEIYLYHYESDSVVFNRSTGKNIAPASTVKIATALLAIQKLGGRLDEKITVTSDMLYGVEGYTIGLKSGDGLTVRDLLYCLICGGGNDAAYVAAYLSYGSVNAFVSNMNTLVQSWGCNGTNFANPTGIDANTAKTTLDDVRIISEKAVNNELYMDMCSVSSYTYIDSFGNEKTIRNRNPLISSHFAMGYQNKRVKGLNAGMTDNGGYCVSAYATNGTDSYLCIVMGGREATDGTITSYTIANTLINYAIDNYSYVPVAKKGEVLEKATVRYALPSNGSEAVTVSCVLMEDIYSYSSVNTDNKDLFTYKTYLFEDVLSAPVKKGDIVGGVDFFYDGYFIGNGVLVTGEDVQESVLLVTIARMKSFLTSRPVIIWLISSAFLLLIFFYFTVLRKKIKKKKHK